MCKFAVAHTRQSPFSGGLARRCLKLTASLRHQRCFSFQGLGPLRTHHEGPRPATIPAAGTSRASCTQPGPVAQELPRLLHPLSLNKRSRRIFRHPAPPGHAGYIGYLGLTLSQCCITPLFPPSSRFSCVSTCFLSVCCHWFPFFIFPSCLVP